MALAKKRYVVTRIDVAEQLITKAQTSAEKQQLKITHQVCDPGSLPFADGHFDAVLLLKTYCYGPKRQNRVARLNEIDRVLKLNGWLLLSQNVFDGAFRQLHSQIFTPPAILLPNLFRPLEWLDHHPRAVSIALAHLRIPNHILPIPGRAMDVGIASLIRKEIPHRETDRIGLIE
ncbi:TPA: class I SAM-dependent methyltransferase [Candidatus Poribacteria bacterium]|nr:class I SAM-dependent methyltransferase [Candidatus Poribacteria bacterium]HIA64683.1 class I SAM-dependent methyltransferase [Candidatus Poribacteria bacterium]HIB90969.1 class I SAM-dependent methyltransferase [Candidatus Poribacteria bacterium]HIO47605.1 class I SAM-dependent methyltransferase [Candidatus Poribacteria bacterium]HIO77388.1 class I SAM-dependent methyltransferase [Candidatus Poribacteria bacterium]